MTESKRAIKHLRQADPKLEGIIFEFGPQELTRSSMNYFHSLARKIVAQQLSVKAAATILKRFEALFPGPKFPKPEQVLEMDPEQIRSAGISYQKVSYLKDLAEHILDNRLPLRKLKQMSDQEVIDALTAVKGIGPWSAEMFLIFTLGRPDVFSHGDVGLRNALRQIYGLPKGASEARVNKIIQPWSPYKSYASLYLWKSLDNE